MIDVEKTNELGNRNAGKYFFDFKTNTDLPVSSIKISYNDEVLKGIAVKFHGSTDEYPAGDLRPGISGLFISEVTLAIDDVILKCLASTAANYGHGSVRQFQLQTRNGIDWAPGFVTDAPVGFSKDNCRNRVVMGFFGSINADFFINSLGLWVSRR